MRTYKSNLTLAVALFASLSAAGIVFAAVFGSGTGEVGLGGGRTTVVNAHNICKKVTNNNSLDLFIPTNTTTEWQNFRDNASNKSLAECNFWELNAGRVIPCDRVWTPGYPVSTVNGVSAPSCYSDGYPQGVYAYAAVDLVGLPWIRLQGYCSYFASYPTFDTGWVQTTALNGQGYCPVGFGWLNNATSVLNSSGFEVHSWYGGGYHGSFFMDWSGNVSYPPDPTLPPPCDPNDPNGGCYECTVNCGGDSGDSFPAGTRVLTTGQGWKPIETIGVGDSVIGGYGKSNKVIGLYRPKLGSRGLYEINGEVSTTKDHLFRTASGKWGALGRKDYEGLRFGKTMGISVGEGQTITRISSKVPPEDVEEIKEGSGLELFDGTVKIISEISELTGYEPDTVLYTLVTDGNESYTVQGGYVADGMPQR